MKDRVSLYPGRVKLTPVAGQENVFDLTRADQPTQEGTALNKGNLLADDTAGLFGLDDAAVPDDVLKMLGPYFEHWWQLQPVNATVALGTQTNTTFNWQSKHTTGTVVYYSDEISVGVYGSADLKNPQSVTIKTYGATTLNSLTKGKYFYSDLYPSIFFQPSNQSASDGSSTSTSVKVQTVTASVTRTGDATYVQSTNRNAYPDDGIHDNIAYSYLGIPMQNAAIPTIKLALGSYFGTGQAGESYPITLTFGGTPLFVVIESVNRYNTASEQMVLVRGVNWGFSEHVNNYNETVIWGENMVTWYDADGNYIRQLNISGRKYAYFAILGTNGAEVIA